MYGNRNEKIALGVGIAIAAGGIAFNRWAARYAKKQRAQAEMIHRWAETIESIDLASPTATVDLQFWNIITDEYVR